MLMVLLELSRCFPTIMKTDVSYTINTMPSTTYQIIYFVHLTRFIWSLDQLHTLELNALNKCQLVSMNIITVHEYDACFINVFQNIKKGPKSLDQYLQRIRDFRDQLAVVGVTIFDEDIATLRGYLQSAIQSKLSFVHVPNCVSNT